MKWPLLLLALTGCAHERFLASQRNARSWIGQDVHRLVSTWGPPSDTYPNGSETIYRWKFMGDTHSRHRGAVTAIGGVGFAGGRSESHTDVCLYWFDVGEAGVILDAHLRGDC